MSSSMRFFIAFYIWGICWIAEATTMKMFHETMKQIKQEVIKHSEQIIRANRIRLMSNDNNNNHNHRLLEVNSIDPCDPAAIKCTTDADCKLGICLKNMCQIQIPDLPCGVPCDPDNRILHTCGDDLVCDPITATCKKQYLANCDCSESTDCVNNFCLKGTCSGLIAATYPCNTSSHCATEVCIGTPPFSYCVNMNDGSSCTNIFSCGYQSYCSGIYDVKVGAGDGGNKVGICKTRIPPLGYCSFGDYLDDGCTAGYFCDLNPITDANPKPSGVCRKIMAAEPGERCSSGPASTMACRPGSACRGNFCTRTGLGACNRNNKCPLGMDCVCDATKKKAICVGEQLQPSVACGEALDKFTECLGSNDTTLAYFYQWPVNDLQNQRFCVKEYINISCEPTCLDPNGILNPVEVDCESTPFALKPLEETLKCTPCLAIPDPCLSNPCGEASACIRIGYSKEYKCVLSTSSTIGICFGVSLGVLFVAFVFNFLRRKRQKKVGAVFDHQPLNDDDGAGGIIHPNLANLANLGTNANNVQVSMEPTTPSTAFDAQTQPTAEQ